MHIRMKQVIRVLVLWIGSSLAFPLLLLAPRTRSLSLSSFSTPNHLSAGHGENNVVKSSTTAVAATEQRPSLHPITIDAIAEALRIRASNNKSMPLRTNHDDNIEDWEIMMTAGKIAQSTLEETSSNDDEESILFNKEEQNTIGARIVATIIRFEYLEEQLRKKCNTAIAELEQEEEVQYYNLGVLGVDEEVQQDLLDETIRNDPVFSTNRAMSLLAIFLDSIERPARRQSGNTLPGGSVPDFLDPVQRKILLTSPEEEERQQKAALSEQPKTSPLHPIALAAICDAFRLRAQKKRFSPLRQKEGVEELQIMVTAGRVAEEAIQNYKRQQNQRDDDDDDTSYRLSPAEERLLGGRIVAVVIRLDELENDLSQRCYQAESLEAKLYYLFGVLEDESDEDKIDQKLSEDVDFSLNRAKGLLAIFLDEYERPSFEQSGKSVPDKIDFLDQNQQAIILPSADVDNF